MSKFDFLWGDEIVSIFRILVLGALLPLGVAPALTQENVEGIWSESTAPFSMQDGVLEGPGSNWLTAQLAEADFVLVGEQHGVNRLADLTAVLEAEFQPDALVLETGPWMGDRLSAAPIEKALALAPFSLAFDYNGDIALLEQHASRTVDRTEIWGVDQEANAIHPFAWISQVSETGATRRVARGLHLKAALQAGEYTRADHQADLEFLAQIAPDEPEILAVIDAVSTSMNIFVTWRSGARGDASAVREQYMIDNFESRASQFRDAVGREPRILFKMGGAHIMEGPVGPNGIMTLGEHVQRRADQNGQTALHLGVRGYSPEHTSYPISEHIEGQSFLLIDTTPLRRAIDTGQFPDLTEDDRADIYGFDALIYINPLEGASKSQISALQSEFRTGLLTKLAVALWPAAFLAVLAIFGLAVLTQRAMKPGPSLIGPNLVLTGATIATLLVFVLQILPLVSGAPGSAQAAPGILPWVPPAVALISLVDVGIRGRADTRNRFIGGLVWALLLVWLAFGMHHWNLGGMLG